MLSEDIDLICLGEPMVEFTRVQTDEEENLYIQGLGGDTSNCAIAAARQGAAVAYITAVGDDRFGGFLHVILRLCHTRNINENSA